MEHVRLGETGLLVSRIALGTATFGTQCDEETSVAILNRADEAGITLLDTADVYPMGGSLDTVGHTEEILGRWLRGRRDKFLIATKCFGRTGTAAWDQGSSRRHVLDAVDASLRRLGTDYLDLYQLHRYDSRTPIEETLEALDHLVRSGKVRYVGCSNFLAYQLARALGRSELRGLQRFASVQPRYNLLFREVERELFPVCEEEGLAVLPYNPLAGGLLTGKHDWTAPPTQGGRFTLGSVAGLYQDRYWNERSFVAVQAIHGLAEQSAIPMPTLAVAWVMAHPAITAPIVGASRPEQLDDVVVAAEIAIEPDLKSALDEATTEFRRGDALR